jgi:hypothetical protein
MKNIIKYTILTLICTSLLIGGFAQIVAWGFSALVYNAYFQFGVGFILMIYLFHKLISYYENRHTKPVTNARDSK